MSGFRYWAICLVVLIISGIVGFRSVGTVLNYVFQSQDGSSTAVKNGPWKTYEGLATVDLHPMVKAMVAHIGLGALTSDEAIYWVSTDDDTAVALNSAEKYEVKFSATPLHEIGGFWSLSLYGDDHFFVENEAGINSLSERSGVQKNPDGSFSVIVSATKPDAPANWLPAPKAGGFSLTLRYYIPKKVMIDAPASVSLPMIKKL
ncbi:DUF1214 domain-containing protein [Sneathiella sp. P13V-1]|uniref:DUF1214 domain-containing protein n=1 Tax=Sneathiella sp. P13V-1 TaxID=2697366 RepID=UPI00187B2312|nr:DUF1214 domain-containing protein [Sneathiella sp. P13V-1]MBE7635929.1 DUF1214 domain-containing protein [Sneathiella sp. P13V-1]